MIEGHCIPPKGIPSVWPSVFAEVPRVNDYVCSSGDIHELKVVKIVHSSITRYKREAWYEYIISLPYRWLCKIGLPLQTKPFIFIYLDDDRK